MRMTLSNIQRKCSSGHKRTMRIWAEKRTQKEMRSVRNRERGDDDYCEIAGDTVKSKTVVACGITKFPKRLRYCGLHESMLYHPSHGSAI